MEKLFSVLFISVFLAYLYEHSYVTTRTGRKRFGLIYACLVATLICFAGFRGSYNDTWNYRDVYAALVKPFPEAWDSFVWTLGENPAFNIVQSFFKTYDADVHLLLMFFSFWTVLFYVEFLRKYHTNFSLTIYFFFTVSCYLLILAAIKQCMATAFCLVAMPFAFARKWFLFFIIIIFASMFHPYALMYLIVPLMGFKPWSKGTYVLISALFVGGLLFQPLIGTVIDITTMIGEGYSAETFSGEGIGAIRIVACWAPIVLSFLYRRVLFSDSTREENIIMNLSVVYAGITFIGNFGTALYFGRLASYFVIMMVVSLAWMLEKIGRYNPRDGWIIKLCVIVCYGFFFIISNTIENDFASSYEALSLGGFMEILVDAFRGGTI